MPCSCSPLSARDPHGSQVFHGLCAPANMTDAPLVCRSRLHRCKCGCLTHANARDTLISCLLQLGSHLSAGIRKWHAYRNAHRNLPYSVSHNGIFLYTVQPSGTTQSIKTDPLVQCRIGQYALGRADLAEAWLPTLDALCSAIVPDIRINMTMSKCLLRRKLLEYS